MAGANGLLEVAYSGEHSGSILLERAVTSSSLA
jgi:hypothetical protein